MSDAKRVWRWQIYPVKNGCLLNTTFVGGGSESEVFTHDDEMRMVTKLADALGLLDEEIEITAESPPCPKS